MLKNIIFSLLSLAALGTSPTLLATDAADQTPVEAVPMETTPAQAIPATMADKEPVMQPASNIHPNNDNLVDYRYCLELKTNQEIAECRYKKK